MCEIFETRINQKANRVFIHLEDEVECAIRKLTIPQYEYARKFGNMDFIAATAKSTNDRDINASYYSVPFVDPAIVYSKY